MILNRAPASPLNYGRPDDVARRALSIDDGRGPAEMTKRLSATMANPPPPFALRVSLRDVEPEVRRSVHVRGDLTLSKLHGVLQKVMGWTDSHLHQFRGDERVYGARSRVPRGSEVRTTRP